MVSDYLEATDMCNGYSKKPISSSESLIADEGYNIVDSNCSSEMLKQVVIPVL